MCPFSHILSVYFDGELGSPWREKFEKHLAECPSCRAELETLHETRRLLGLPVPGMETAMERVWEKTAAFRPRRHRNFWTASIPVPLPAAAAAALIMALSMAALITLRQPVKASHDPQLAGMELQDMTAVSDMAGLLQYLGGDDSPDMVIIRLPDTTFRNAGEPKMLRAADYSRSAGPR